MGAILHLILYMMFYYYYVLLGVFYDLFSVPDLHECFQLLESVRFGHQQSSFEGL